jgi:CAP12/Pycsar effector protein, TIR domain
MSKNIKGLAWDDKQADYMAGLKQHLHHRDIELEICQKQEDFYAAFNRGGWSFVVIDLLDQSVPNTPPAGIDLANYVSNANRQPWFPILVVTREMQLVVGDYYKQLPAGAVLSYKIPPPLMALNIQHSLEQRGLYVDHRKVFIISRFVGNSLAPAADRFANWMRHRGIEVVTLASSAINSEIVAGLVATMNTCAAVVAICSADDELGGKDAGKYQPRPNVLLEIGIAVGLWRGIERLVLVREKTAQIPSDIGGVLRIDFENVDDVLDELQAALISKGVEFA